MGTSAALVRREAEAAADPEPVADPEAEPVYGLNVNGGYAEPVCTLTPVKTCKPRQVESPRKVCQTVFDLYEDVVVPEKACERIPTSTPRKVARTVCDTVVDVTTIEDCTETVTKHCQHTSSSTSSSSQVVGSHSKVVTNALHAVAHPAVPSNVIG